MATYDNTPGFRENICMHKTRYALRFPHAGISALIILYGIMLPISYAFTLCFPIKKQYAMEVFIPPVNAPPKIKMTTMNLYVDSLQRHWWSIENDTVSKPVHLVIDAGKVIDVDAYLLNDSDLDTILRKSLEKYQRLKIQMIIHGNNHFKDFVNILDAIEMVETAKSGVHSYKSKPVIGSFTTSMMRINCLLTFQPVADRRFINYSFRKWTEEDNRLIRYAVADIERYLFKQVI